MVRVPHAFRRSAAALGVLLVALAPLGPIRTADADPLPATYSGSTHGDILDLDVTAAGGPIDAVIAHSSTTTSSTTANRAHAESANIHAGAIGLGVGVVTDSADSTTSTQNDSYTANLGQADVLPLLDTGLITGNGSTRWDGDAACVPDGTPIAQSTTQLASAVLGIPGVQILNLGVTTTTGSTTLDTGSVRSTSAGNITSLSLVNGLVDVDVVTQPQLTATSNGTTGTSSANAYAVDVTIASVTTRITAGGSIPINLTIPGIADVALVLSVGTLANTSSGATGSGSTTFLSLTGGITVPLIGTSLATVNVGILPLSVSATAPTGGVECGALDPPVITVPTNGATVGETPTISGTGIPGATVTVKEGPTTIGTAVVTGAGTWSLVPATPLSLGSHTITATQQLGTPVSGQSNAVTFTVTDQTGPAAPVVATPADESVTNDTTPTITGTAEPGATVNVSVDGTPIGTTTADGTGAWTFLPATPLPAGPHTVNATQTDLGGNTSAVSNTNDFTIDTTAAAPVISAPADGSVTNDTTPTITGTAEPGATVTVTMDGTTLGTTTADGTGAWTFLPATPLPEGPHTVNATQTDPAGNTSPAASNDFTVDTTANAPVVLTPANGSATNDTTPPITGTAEPGATVTVSVDGTPIGTTTADGTGSWTLTPGTPLAEGLHTVNATQTDPAGNTSPVSNTNTFTIDTTAPAAPVVATPANLSFTNDTTPAITGTAEPGAVVTVSVDGAPIGTTTADGTGAWTFLPATPLPEGPHTVNATQTDPAGNTSPVSNTNTFTIDTTAPAAPVVVSPANGSTTNDDTPALTGTAGSGATVTVSVDGTVLGTTVANLAGSWTLIPATPLAEGAHTVSATESDLAGNTSPVSNTNTFTIDTTAPGAPVVSTPANGSTTNDTTPTITGTAQPGATVTVSVDGTPIGTTTADGTGSWSLTPGTGLAEGTHTVNATQADPAGNTSPVSNTNTFTIDTTAPGAPVVATPADNSITNDTTPTITGTAEAGATVTVVVDGTPIGTTTADGTGSWVFQPLAPLTEGPHTVSATQTDPAGNTGPASSTNTFTIDSTAPLPPVISAPADGSTTNDTTPTVTGTAEAGATVTVSVDGTPIGTTTADGTGNWSLTPGTPLPEGPHTVTATQTDPAGNTSPAASNDFTVDTTAVAPIISTPTDGSTTNDTTPTVTGTAEAGATVTVSVDGTPIGTTTADGTGNWSLTPGTPLPEGPHTVTATQTDPAGNTSPASNPTDFTVDTTGPAAPTIVVPADGSTTTDSTPTISGTGEPGGTVHVSVDGTPIGTAPIGSTGNWTLVPTTPLVDGPHTVTATQTDPAGNTGPADTQDFRVDVVEPLELTNGGTGSTADATPTFEGTGEPGATVEVAIDGIVVGTTVVGADGTWTFTPSDRLACGTHQMRAQVVGSSQPPVTSEFTVTCSTDDGLPQSGMSGNLSGLGGLGLAVVLAGSVFLRIGRHRRRIST